MTCPDCQRALAQHADTVWDCADCAYSVSSAENSELADFVSSAMFIEDALVWRPLLADSMDVERGTARVHVAE